MEGGLVGGGDGVFGAAEAVDLGGEMGPIGVFEGEEKFVDVVEGIVAADESGFNFFGDREGAEDFGDGLIEERIGDGEKAHKEESRLFFGETGGGGKLFAEVGARERSADKLGRLAAGHGDDGEDGDPATEFLFAEESESLADAADFVAETEQRRVEVAKQAVEKGGLAFQNSFDESVVEFGGSDGVEEFEVQEFVGGEGAGFEHGRLAEEVALKIGEAEMVSLGELVLGFDFFGEEGETVVRVFGGKALAAVLVEKLEIDLEEMHEFDEWLEGGLVDEIIEGENVASVAKIAADVEDFGGRRNGFEDLNDDAIGRKDAWSAEAKCEFIDVDEGAGTPGEGVEVEKGDGIGDDGGCGIRRGLEEILRTAAEEEFVSKEAKALIENGLAGHERCGHRATFRRSEMIEL